MFVRQFRSENQVIEGHDGKGAWAIAVEFV